MVSNPIQQHRPSFGAVVTHKDVCEQDDGEGLGGITQPVDSFVHESSKNPQFITAHQTDHSKGDQACQIRKDVFDCFETFLIGIVLELGRFFRELVAQFCIIEGLHTLEKGIELKLLFV